MRWARRATMALVGVVTMATFLGGTGVPGAGPLGGTGRPGGSGASVSVALAAGTPLREVDWDAVLASEPGLTYAEEPLFPGSLLRTHVSLTGADGEVSGYPLFEDVGYEDLDGDGAEEALIPLFSGGTAGNVGLLLYREAPDRPRLVLARSGYKLGMSLDAGRLVLYEPAYVGFEPNCCPSASTISTYRLVGDRLVQETFEVEPNEEAREVTVYGFYAAISDGDLEAAYAFYSPALKAANPFEEWRAGYRDTLRIEVDTGLGSRPDEVAVDLTATDRAPGGGTITRRFTGTWAVVWSPADRRWLLDKAQIAAVP